MPRDGLRPARRTRRRARASPCGVDLAARFAREPCCVLWARRSLVAPRGSVKLTFTRRTNGEGSLNKRLGVRATHRGAPMPSPSPRSMRVDGVGETLVDAPDTSANRFKPP